MNLNYQYMQRRREIKRQADKTAAAKAGGMWGCAAWGKEAFEAGRSPCVFPWPLGTDQWRAAWAGWAGALDRRFGNE